MSTRTADMSVRSIRTIWPIHPTNASRTKSQNLSRCTLCRHCSVRLVPAKADSPLRFRTVTSHLTGDPSIDTARFSHLHRVLARRMMRAKMKTLLLSTVAFSLCISSLRCLAQEVPAIYLSPSEVTKAKEAVQGFKSAQERYNRAITAWQSFFNGYHAAHPELPGLQFTSDFRFAFTKKGNSRFPWEAEAVTIELSPEERQKAESLYREMLEAIVAPTKLDATGRIIGMNSCSTTSQ